MTAGRVDLDRFFAPDGVALIGRVDRGAGAATLRKAHDERWGSGNWHLVNPRGGRVGTIPVHVDIDAIDAPITLAVLSTPPAACADIVRQCGARGVEFALVFSSGFAEVGAEGAALEAELARAGREAGVRIIGPNTNTNAFERYPDPGERFGGRIAVVTQSGHNGRPIVQGADLGIRFSRMIPTGNEADVDICDFIEFLATDPATDVIAAYIEGFHDGERLRHALHNSLVAGKPVVAMKIGETEAGARMARTHTGHLVGSDAIVQAVLDRYGVCRVRDLDELLDTAALFARMPPSTGPRVALYSISGGSGTLMAEAAERHGVPLAELTDTTRDRLRRHIPDHLTVDNPIDNGGTFVTTQPAEVRRQVMRDILDDPGVDILVVGITGAVAPMTDLLAEDIHALAGAVDKPIVATWNSPRTDEAGFRTLLDSGVPLFRSFRNCFLALAGFERHRQARAGYRIRTLTADAAAEPHPDTGSDANSLLSRFGIPTVERWVAHDAEQATAAVASAGSRAALKILSADIEHKSDLGLVRLDVSGSDAARTFDDLMATAARVAPGAEIDGVEIQPMVDDGVEMIVGVLRDPVLGPAVVVGTGGIHTEVLADRAVRPVPIDRTDAEEMVASLRGLALLRGARGRPPADIDALVDVIERVGTLAATLGDRLAELDLNPVVVRPQGLGAVAVDVLIVTNPPST